MLKIYLLYLLEIHKKVIYIHIIACLKKLIELSSVFGILKFARTFVQALFFSRTRRSPIFGLVPSRT